MAGRQAGTAAASFHDRCGEGCPVLTLKPELAAPSSTSGRACAKASCGDSGREQRATTCALPRKAERQEGRAGALWPCWRRRNSFFLGGPSDSDRPRCFFFLKMPVTTA